jgi:hypothetical protein
MKMIVLFFALSCSVLASSQVCSQVTTKEYALEYQPGFSRGDPGELAKRLHIYVKLDTVQYEQQGGITFSVRYNNPTTESIVTINPLDFIQISLINSKWVDMMPHVTSRVMHCGTDPATIPVFAYYRDKYLIESVLLNNKPAPYNMDANNIMLPGESNLVITFRIPEVVDWKAAKPKAPPPRIKTPADKYLFTLTQSLKTGNLSSFATYKAGFVSINYGPGPDNSHVLTHK